MFMNEEFTFKNIKNNEPSLSKEEFDYKNLITKLKEIKTTIALLQKTIFK